MSVTMKSLIRLYHPSVTPIKRHRDAMIRDKDLSDKPVLLT